MDSNKLLMMAGLEGVVEGQRGYIDLPGTTLPLDSFAIRTHTRCMRRTLNPIGGSKQQTGLNIELKLIEA